MKPDTALPDTVTRMGDSLVRHGPLSRRVYLMNLARDDCPGIVPEFENLALNNSKKAGTLPGIPPSEHYRVSQMGPGDAREMADLYSRVFDSCPYPPG